MSICEPCQRGDHSQHFPKLDGVCIGCECAVKALDDTEVTEIAPGLYAVPLKPAGDDEPIPEGGYGVANGVRFQRRDGFFRRHPAGVWLSFDEDMDEHERENPDSYYDTLTRAEVESIYGPLLPEVPR